MNIFLRSLWGPAAQKDIREIGRMFTDKIREQRLDMAENEIRILRANLPKRLQNKSLLELAQRRSVPFTGLAKVAADKLHEDFEL